VSRFFGFAKGGGSARSLGQNRIAPQEWSKFFFEEWVFAVCGAASVAASIPPRIAEFFFEK
jgi:hypothetical protein